MASNIVANEVSITQDIAWGEARIESSMERLQEMHARLRNLRDAVSRLVDPMLVQQHSPEELYNTFATNVTTTKADVQGFARLFRDDESKELFKRAAESRAQNSENIRGWRVTEHEDWLDVRNVDVPGNLGTAGTTESDPNISQITTKEDLHAAMERFRKDHPGIDGSFDEVSKNLTVANLRH
ncbi:MAG: hypothetical protein Q9166_005488 [cf. Caloplaca sp. 2 TL-2023]